MAWPQTRAEIEIHITYRKIHIQARNVKTFLRNKEHVILQFLKGLCNSVYVCEASIHAWKVHWRRNTEFSWSIIRDWFSNLPNSTKRFVINVGSVCQKTYSQDNYTRHHSHHVLQKRDRGRRPLQWERMQSTKTFSRHQLAEYQHTFYIGSMIQSKWPRQGYSGLFIGGGILQSSSLF